MSGISRGDNIANKWPTLVEYRQSLYIHNRTQFSPAMRVAASMGSISRNELPLRSATPAGWEHPWACAASYSSHGPPMIHPQNCVAFPHTYFCNIHSALVWTLQTGCDQRCICSVNSKFIVLYGPLMYLCSENHPYHVPYRTVGRKTLSIRDCTYTHIFWHVPNTVCMVRNPSLNAYGSSVEK
jgi:hypothetical protein